MVHRVGETEVHKWPHLDVEKRQRLIREFYKTGSVELGDDFLSLVRAPRGYGVYASIGPNYQYAIFGRDSIRVAQDLLYTNQKLAREIIVFLAYLQGRSFNMVREEEPGKIHHEFRSLRFSGHEVPKAAQLALKKWAALWGGNQEQMLYYGSFDATPAYIRLVDKYCQAYGTEILDTLVASRGGRSRSLREHVRRATDWMVSKITASPWQLFEFKRLNLAGLFNQSWEDSNISYLHNNGSVANADSGIAAIELQAEVYDALRGAADIVSINGDEANAWRHLASIVRDNTLRLLWMDDKKYFAIGLDRADDGAMRQIKTLSANPGSLLRTTMLTLLPHHVAWPYVEGIVKMLFSEEFIVLPGLRLRGRSHATLVDFADYHGCFVSWPKETYEVAMGLRNHGFYTLATILEQCVLRAVAQAGEFYEFFFVDTKGRTKYHYRQENPDEPTFHEFGAANLPEPGQSWTISAVLSIIASRQKPVAILPVNDSIKMLEQSILKQDNIVELIKELGASGFPVEMHR